MSYEVLSVEYTLTYIRLLSTVMHPEHKNRPYIIFRSDLILLCIYK